VAVLRAHRVAQARRLVAGLELVFTSEQGTPYQLSNVRRAFKAALPSVNTQNRPYVIT
jgi:hypothetical protein